MDGSGDALAHHGVKGMKWGVRKERKPTVTVTQKPGRRLKAEGGYNRKASVDAVRAVKAKQIAKKSSIDALSNEELRNLVARMNLEQQYERMSHNERNIGQKVVGQLVKDYVNNPTGANNKYNAYLDTFGNSYSKLKKDLKD